MENAMKFVFKFSVLQTLSAGNDARKCAEFSEEFLSKDVCLQPRLKRKFLLRRTWSGQELPRNQVSLVRTHFSNPESDEQSADVGGGVESGS